MNRRTIASTVAGWAAVIVLAGSCTMAGAPAAGTAAPASGPQKPGATPVSTGDAPVGDMADLLIVRMAAVTTNDAYAVIDPLGRRILFDLPDGVVSRDWRTLVSLSRAGATTTVAVTVPEGMAMPLDIPVAGAWRLPTIGVAHRAGGLSADGTMLVLEEALDAAPATLSSRTRFAIVPTGGSKAPRIVTLDGSFSYDTLSPDGQWLYVIEHLPGADATHYQVRRVDVATGALQDGTIVDKRNIGEQMSGYAITQEAGRGGWVYTLYRGNDGAFIHALDTTNGAAVCIDLPGMGKGDAASSAAWSLVADPMGDWLYAADPTLKSVKAIDLSDFSVRRSGSLASEPTVVFAKLESATPVAGRAALSPDRKTLYVLDTTGVAVIRVDDLKLIGHLGGSGVFRSLAVGSQGTVYAVDDARRVVRLEAGSAAPIQVADGTYTSIVAIVPMR
jgi:hypothetical protein